MSKPLPPAAQRLARPKTSDLLKKKKPLGAEGELAQTDLLSAEGVQVAEASGTTGAGSSGAGSTTGGGASSAGAAGGAGSWLTSAWTWIGVAAAGGAAAAGGGGGAAPAAPAAPTADDATLTALEDAPTYNGILPGHDANGDTLTYSVVGGTPAGVTVNADGSFSVTPLAADQALDSGETRSFTFQYTANDGTADSAPATVTITIIGANDAPLSGGNTSVSGSEDAASITGNVPAASDVDGEILTYSLTAAAPAGLTFNSDGSFSYVPQAADNALDMNEFRGITFQYVASDGTGSSAAAMVTINIAGTNDAPVPGGAASASGSEDAASITGNVPAASDVDVEALTYALTAAAPAGLTFNSDGTFSYVPQAVDNALDSGETRQFTFQYVANDGFANSAPATVTITVSGANDAPVGSNATANGSEDAASITGSVSASDVDVETLTYALTAAAPAGLTFNSDGTFSYMPQAADSALDAGETRQITFQYVASDGTTTSAPATATITITGANDAPIITAGAEQPAAPQKDGPEFRVNTTTADEQRDPAIAALGDGGYVVTWMGQGQDGSGYGIFAQRYDADDTLVGGEFQVNTTTANWQQSPSMLALADGGFVVAWRSDAQDPDGSSGIYAQRYDADGDVVGSEFRVNTYTSGSQSSAHLAALGDGGFIVGWASQHQDGSGWGTYVQRYDADGNAVGGELLVNAGVTTDNQFIDAISGLPDGGFLVTWRGSETADPFYHDLFAQRFDAAGVPLGGAFSVSDPAPDNQGGGDIAVLADGGFVIAWTSSENSTIYAKRYDGSGVASGAEFLVTVPDANIWRFGPEVTALPDGGFVIVWTSTLQDGSVAGLYMQRYAADGSPIGVETLVNTTTQGDQSAVVMALLADGSLVAAWESSAAGYSGYEVHAQRLQPGSLAGDEGLAAENLAATASGTLLASDDEGHDVTWSITDDSDYGSMAIDADGNWTFTLDDSNTEVNALDEGDTLTASFTATATDEAGASSTHTVTVTISGRNDAPVVADVALSGSADGIIPLPLTANDPEGNSVTLYQAFSTMVPVTFVDGSMAYAPQAEDIALAEGETREFDFHYVATDGRLFSTTATATITVTGVNDAPEITDAGALDALGDEFQVNTFTANSQVVPQVTALADGGFVVLWTSQGQDENGEPTGEGVYGQRYDADGVPVGSEFQVNTTTASNQFMPYVAPLAGGGFAVAWTSGTWDSGQDGSGAGAYARVYDADGMALGNEFQVATATAGHQLALDCVRLDGGGFAVLWGSLFGDSDGVHVQRYDAAGAVDGAPLQVLPSLMPMYFEYQPVTLLPDGNFLTLAVVPNINGGEEINARILSADAQTELASFRISEPYAISPVVTVLADGGFVVVFESSGIQARLYSADGTPAGDAFQVAATEVMVTSTGTPVVVALPDGGFVVSWTSYEFMTGDNDVYARRYDAAGAPLGDAMLINTTDSNGQTYSELAVLADGSLLAAWMSNSQDGDDFGIFARRLSAPPQFNDAGAVSEDEAVATGQLVAVDPDHGDSGSWSVVDDTPDTNYGTLTLNADGSWQYALDTRNAAIKALGDGQSVTETFTATFTDSLGLSDTHTITLTIEGAEGDYVLGTADNDVLTGSAGDDIFDGGTGALDTFVESSAASDDVYIYRYGTDGCDDIAETTAANGDDEDVLEIHDAMADMLDFTADGSDLIIDVNGDGSDDIRIQAFFSADQSVLDADIEEVVVYSDTGETELARYTSQQIHDQLFP